MIPLSTKSRQDYRTPQWLWRVLDDKFRPTLDAAADASNTLCRRWFGPGSDTPDALIAEWRSKRIFCNPPYANTRGGIRAWLDRGHAGIQSGVAELVVFLLPANTTGTHWFRLYAPQSRVIFLSPRVAFEDRYGRKVPSPPHASMLLIMDGVTLPGINAETPIRSSVWYLREDKQQPAVSAAKENMTCKSE